MTKMALDSSPQAVAQRVRVTVVHPGRQHAYEAVAAAYAAGMLEAFVTGFYAGGTTLGRAAWSLASRIPITHIARAIRDRRSSAFPEALVSSDPLRPSLARLFRPLPFDSRLSERAEQATAARCARLIAKADPPPTIVHAFEGAALQTLAAARRIDAGTVLDVPSAHEEYVEVARENGIRIDPASTERIRRERELAEILLVPSPKVAHCLIRHGVPPERCIPLPYGVHAARFGPAPVPQRVFRFLYVGQITPRKGIEHLLEAWTRLALPGAELVLVGALERSCRPLLRSFARYRSITHLGYVANAELRARYDTASAFVFPSLADAWGLVVTDAMAAGLPVIVTTATGAPVRPNVDGLVVPPRDAGALAEAMARLYADRKLARELGESGRRLVVEHFTWADYRRRLQTIYRAFARGEDVQGLALQELPPAVSPAFTEVLRG